MNKMAANEKVREWWDVTDQMQVSSNTVLMVFGFGYI